MASARNHFYDFRMLEAKGRRSPADLSCPAAAWSELEEHDADLPIPRSLTVLQEPEPEPEPATPAETEPTEETHCRGKQSRKTATAEPEK